MALKNVRMINLLNIARLLGDLFLRSSLWMIEAALMLASSGIDGAYLSAWMPPRLSWTGYVLNTAMDSATAILMYWFGILQRDPSANKRKRSGWILVAEGFSVLASWFLSWRQLRRVLPAIEPEDWKMVSFLAAMIVPVFLAFIGYCQSLLARRVDLPKSAETARGVAGSETEVPEAKRQVAAALPATSGSVATLADWRDILPHLNGERAEMTASDVGDILAENGYALPSPRTMRSWASMARYKAQR